MWRRQAAELPQSVERVRALAGRGLEGDRYAAGIGTFSERPGKRDVTLIESETLEAYTRESGQKLSAAEARRNLLTQGVRLNDLVGCEFQVGTVRLRGLRLSEPCTHLMRLTHPGTLRGLVHRGGLRGRGALRWRARRGRQDQGKWRVMSNNRLAEIRDEALEQTSKRSSSEA